MDNGVVVEDDSIDNVIFNPKSEVTKSLLGTVGLNIEDLICKYKAFSNLSLLRFEKASRQDAIISEISINHQVKINILYANITPKENGIMLVNIDADNIDTIYNIFSSLKEKGVDVRHV